MTRLKSITPQFLVADLSAALCHYEERLGFHRQIDYGGFYASVVRDSVEIHLKCADKPPGERAHRLNDEHLDAFIETDDVIGLHDELASRGASILRAIETRPWGARDFYVLDLDGYVLCFSETTASES